MKQHWGFVIECPCGFFRGRCAYRLGKYQRLIRNLGIYRFAGVPSDTNVTYRRRKFRLLACSNLKTGCGCTQEWTWENLRHWLIHYDIHYSNLRHLQSYTSCRCETVHISWDICYGSTYWEGANKPLHTAYLAGNGLKDIEQLVEQHRLASLKQLGIADPRRSVQPPPPAIHKSADRYVEAFLVVMTVVAMFGTLFRTYRLPDCI